MQQITDVVKNLIILNIIVFIVFHFVFQNYSYYVQAYYPGSQSFLPVQLIGHMFMHADFMHIFFNMFMLFMFGTVLENYWGGKFFLFYYLVCGFGAIAIHFLVKYINLQFLLDEITPAEYDYIYRGGKEIYKESTLKLYQILNVPAVGASGAVYGLLAGFGLQFPRQKLMLLFLPVPIEARIFIPILIGIEFFMGMNGGDNIAHFAHLGGALFGFILFKYRFKFKF